MRAALVGYGLAGQVIHRPLLQACSGWEVTHVVTSSETRREAAGQDLPDAAVVDTAEDLWQRADEFDVAVIVTPNDVHVPLARRCIGLGKRVVVDKPLATTAAEAADLLADARRSGVPLSVFHNRRWDSDTLTARDLIAAGALGTVHRLESRFTRFRPQVAQRWREQPGGGGRCSTSGRTWSTRRCTCWDRWRRSTPRCGSVARGRWSTTTTSWRSRTGPAPALCCGARRPRPGRVLASCSRATPVAGRSRTSTARSRRSGAGSRSLPSRTARCGTAPGAGTSRVVPGTGAPTTGRSEKRCGPGRRIPVEPEDAVAVLRVLEAAVLSSQRREVVVLR